jgi:hypothetical protein
MSKPLIIGRWTDLHPEQKLEYEQRFNSLIKDRVSPVKSEIDIRRIRSSGLGFYVVENAGLLGHDRNIVEFCKEDRIKQGTSRDLAIPYNRINLGHAVDLEKYTQDPMDEENKIVETGIAFYTYEHMNEDERGYFQLIGEGRLGRSDNNIPLLQLAGVSLVARHIQVFEDLRVGQDIQRVPYPFDEQR